jgi:hypothetical protein
MRNGVRESWRCCLWRRRLNNSGIVIQNNRLVRVDKKSARHAATAQTAKLLGRIIKDGVARLTKAATAVSKEWARQFTEWLVTKVASLG